MSITKFTSSTKRSVSSVGVTAQAQPSSFTPVTTSKNAANQLTPAGAVVSSSVSVAPKDRTLNSTGTAVNRPTPVGEP